MNEPISPHPFPTDGATTAEEPTDADIAELTALAEKCERETQIFLGFRNIRRAASIRRILAQLAEREQENARLSAALAEAQRDGERAWELIDDALAVMREPMTLKAARHARTALTHNLVEYKKLRARSPSQPEPQ